MPTLDFWFEFASTYSYLSAMRIAPLAQAAKVEVRWRPFLLGPVFKAQGWDSSPFNIYPAKGRYMWRDMERLCAGLGLPLVKPDPFPQNGMLAARTAIIALQQGWGEDFCRGVFKAEFGNGRNISEPETITSILSSLGQNAAHVLGEAQADTNKARLRVHTEEAQRIGIFGAPAFVAADGELFWGNDRLEAALLWTQHNG